MRLMQEDRDKEAAAAAAALGDVAGPSGAVDIQDVGAGVGAMQPPQMVSLAGAAYTIHDGSPSPQQQQQEIGDTALAYPEYDMGVESEDEDAGVGVGVSVGEQVQVQAMHPSPVAPQQAWLQQQ